VFSMIACAICGGDPATDTMLVNAALAGVLGLPWMFKDRIFSVARRLRVEQSTEPEACELGDPSPRSARALGSGRFTRKCQIGAQRSGVGLRS
jgi:hypothetical protein